MSISTISYLDDRSRLATDEIGHKVEVLPILSSGLTRIFR